jgi:hypothetical protein
MSIRAVIVDVSDTLMTTDAPHAAVRGAAEMVTRLRARGIDVFLATNHAARDRHACDLVDIAHDHLLHPGLVGSTKGKGGYIAAVCDRMGIGRNELLYLGDDRFDFYEAINHGVLFFLAQWGHPTTTYGIPVDRPAEFVRLVETFFLKDALWYFRVDAADQSGRLVTVRALMRPEETKMTGIMTLLKDKHLLPGTSIAGYPLDVYLSLHLLASVYFGGAAPSRQPYLVPLSCARWCPNRCAPAVRRNGREAVQGQVFPARPHPAPHAGCQSLEGEIGEAVGILR